MYRRRQLRLPRRPHIPVPSTIIGFMLTMVGMPSFFVVRQANFIIIMRADAFWLTRRETPITAAAEIAEVTNNGRRIKESTGKISWGHTRPQIAGSAEDLLITW